MPEFYIILGRKNIKIPRIFTIFARKINKIPEFTRFLPENARILQDNCPKNIFYEFGGACPLCPPRLLLLWPLDAFMKKMVVSHGCAE